MAARLSDRAAPALDAILRGPLAFNCVARLRIPWQQKRGCARKQVARNLSDGRACASGQIHPHELVESWRSVNQGTKAGRARKIVAHAVAAEEFTAGAVLRLRVERFHVVPASHICQIEAQSGQPFIEKPEAAGVRACRLAPDDSLDFFRTCCYE